MNDDLRELLALLNSHQVDYLIIGAHAVAFHGHQRFTEDLDIWARATADSARRLRDALEDFGAPIGDEGARRFALPDREMVRIGVPPHMAYILNSSGGPEFEQVWGARIPGELEGVAVSFPSKQDLIAIKRAAGGLQDLADIEKLDK